MNDFPFIKTGLALSLAGGMIEGRSSRAVASTPSEAHKAEFQAWTTGGALISDLGAGLVVYGIYKRSPFWGGAVGLGWLALTVMGTKNPEKTLNAMERWGSERVPPPAARTGWEPWWERRERRDRDREWDPYRFSRFGTLGNAPPPKTPVTYTSAPMPQPVTYAPAYMPNTAPPVTYVPSSADFGPGF